MSKNTNTPTVLDHTRVPASIPWVVRAEVPVGHGARPTLTVGTLSERRWLADFLLEELGIRSSADLTADQPGSGSFTLILRRDADLAEVTGDLFDLWGIPTSWIGEPPAAVAARFAPVRSEEQAA